MNGQEQINNLLIRLYNNEIKYDANDYYLIENVPELSKVYLKKIARGKIPLNPQFIWIFESILSNYVGSLDLTKEDFENACFVFAIGLLENDGYCFNFANEIAGAFNLDDSFIEKLNRYVENLFADRTKAFKVYSVNDGLLNELLDAKRYDVILNIVRDDIDSGEVISEDVYNRIKNECPFSDDNYPEILKYYEKKNNIYVWSSADSFDDLLSVYRDDYDKMGDQIRTIIYDKINNEPNLDYLNDNTTVLIGLISYPFSSVLGPPSVFSGKQKEEVIELLKRKNCLVGYSNSIDKDELQNTIQKFVDNHLNISTEFLDRFSVNPFLIDGLTDLLIDQGDLLYLLDKDASYRNDGNQGYLTKYIPKIIELFNSNKYDHFLEYFTYTKSMGYYPELFEAVLRTGKTKSLYIFGAEYKEFKDSILASLKTLKDASLLIDALLGYGIDCPDVLLSFMGQPIITEEILDNINHHENLEHYYNHEMFEKCKDYFAKKYNLSLSNMEKIEQRLGPKILRYITNDNFFQFVQLPLPELDKLLDLFSNTQYDMVDLFAHVESLIQYQFGCNNYDIISVFPSFIRAIDDNNIDLIEQIKKELTTSIRQDFLISLVQKYNLSSIKGVDDLLDLIISKSSTIERDTYFNILHEITDEYISLKRANYSNNYFFEKAYPDYANIYNNLLQAILTNNNQLFIKYAGLVGDFVDYDFIDRISEKYPEMFKGIFKNRITPNFLFDFVVGKIRDTVSRNDYIEILKEMADNATNNLKEICAEKLSIQIQLGLPYHFEEKNLRNEITKYLIRNADMFMINDSQNFDDLITNELVNDGFSLNLINGIREYYVKGTTTYENQNDVKKNIGLFVKVATRIINNTSLKEYYEEPKRDFIVKELDNNNLLKRNYYIGTNSIDLYQVLLNLNLSVLRESVFQDEKIYNQLLEIMKKKKLHLLPDELKKMLSYSNISDDYTNIAGFISFFATILEEEKKRYASSGKDPRLILTSLPDILIKAETYSAVSSVYSQVLGDKDAKLIKTNPGPNSAYKKLENNGRLNEAVKLTVSNFQRHQVTVPTFDEVVDIASGNKKINIIVGNFTDTSNLTHGERTGACMRIGGVGESLFDFCLNNPNGFHIRFDDPVDQEYISRVSGFRNGNTVFLNELRNSCNIEKYSDLDIVEACKIAARRLIELSKYSTCPIQNVVISNQYAMSYSSDRVVNLNINDNKEGLPKFYSDITINGIVLASTLPNDELVPISFDKSNVPVYAPVRSKVKFLNKSSELVGRINRVASIKALLNGVNFDEVSILPFDTGIIYGIVSDDWYLYVDENYQILGDYIDEDSRVQEEFFHYMEVLEQMISMNQIRSDSYGL